VQPYVARDRRELDLAQEMPQRLWAEYYTYVKALDPARGVTSAEELRRMTEASEWTGKVYAVEQALFMAEHGTPAIIGSHEEYQWLTSVDYDITGFLALSPDVVLGKYLAVTRRDGSSLHLTDQELSDGWWTTDVAKVFQGTSWGPPEYRDDWKVAYSPRLTSIHGLPNETHDECCAGYDEWYVFEQEVAAGEIEALVNWVGFRLNDPVYQWCADRFWQQMDRLAPESSLATALCSRAFARPVLPMAIDSAASARLPQFPAIIRE
jgi:hypothetical protein